MSELPIFSRECDERIAELEAENERLRDALEYIRYNVRKIRPEPISYLAQRALKGEEK